MEKRNLQISYEQAKNWYKGTNEELKQLALETFPELGKKELPKTWEELNEINGFYTSVDSLVYYANEDAKEQNKSTFATKEQAEASIALAQLSQLREVYRNGWVPNWDDNSYKAVIRFNKNEISQDAFMHTNFFLSFQDAETRNLFLENFRELIEKAKPLMS